MGHCYEFETEIQAGCDHPMVAREDSCACPDCGAVCTGKFNGCSSVWARGERKVELFAPARRGDTPERDALGAGEMAWPTPPDLPPIERASATSDRAVVRPPQAPELEPERGPEPELESEPELEPDPEPDPEPEPEPPRAWAGPVSEPLEPPVESNAAAVAETPLEALVVETPDEPAEQLVARRVEPDVARAVEPIVEPVADAATVADVEPPAPPRASSRDPDPDPDFGVELAWPRDDTDVPADNGAPTEVEPVAAPPAPVSPGDLYVQWSDTELQRVVASAFRHPSAAPSADAPASNAPSSDAPLTDAQLTDAPFALRSRNGEPSTALVSPEHPQNRPRPARRGRDRAVAPRKPTPRPVPPPVKVVVPSARPERKARRSRWIVVVSALAALGMVAALAAIGALLQRGSGDGTAAAPAAPGPTRLVFDTVTISDGITADRVWELHGREGTRFEASVTYTNTTGAPVSGVHEEVVPKSLAASVDDITFDSVPTTIVEMDPVFQFDITVPANDTLTLRYEIDVDPDGNRRARLEQWASDLGAEVARRAAAVAVPETAPPETTPPAPATVRRSAPRGAVTPAPEPTSSPPPAPTDAPTTTTATTATTTTAPPAP